VHLIQLPHSTGYVVTPGVEVFTEPTMSCGNGIPVEEVANASNVGGIDSIGDARAAALGKETAHTLIHLRPEAP
jgi:hypothetical protein